MGLLLYEKDTSDFGFLCICDMVCYQEQVFWIVQVFWLILLLKQSVFQSSCSVALILLTHTVGDLVLVYVGEGIYAVHMHRPRSLWGVWASRFTQRNGQKIFSHSRLSMGVFYAWHWSIRYHIWGSSQVNLLINGHKSWCDDRIYLHYVYLHVLIGLYA